MSVRIGVNAAATVAKLAAEAGGTVVLTEGDKRGSVIVDNGKTEQVVNMRGKVVA